MHFICSVGSLFLQLEQVVLCLYFVFILVQMQVHYACSVGVCISITGTFQLHCDSIMLAFLIIM